MKPILKFIGAILIFALLAAFVSVVISSIFSSTSINAFYDGPNWVGVLSLTNLVVGIGIPILFAAMAIGRIAFGSKARTSVIMILSILWFGNLTSAAISASKIADSYEEQASEVETIVIADVDTLIVSNAELEDRDNFEINLGEMSITKKFINSEFVEVDFSSSDSDQFEIEIERSSRGSSLNNAKSLLESMNYNVEIEGDRLEIPQFISVSKDGEWRVPQVGVTVKVPNGKYITFDGDCRSCNRIEAKNGKFMTWKGNIWINEGETFRKVK